MKNLAATLILSLISNVLLAQTPNAADTVRKLETVTIKAYLSEQPLLSAPSSAYSVSQSQIEEKSTTSILPVLNTVSGVRMEERSPGSYRLSIRGSLLRSPFGVRNVKIYFDGFPLTDAGGNAYLNLVAQSGIKGIEILKGPDGSLFGANSGGVALIETMGNKNEANFGLRTGSYGLFNENAGLQNQSGKISYTINQDYQRADGYRDHSYMLRNYVQTQEKYAYGKGNQLRFSGFYSDLQYQTPGGLTLAQLQTNPKAARPGTSTVPGPEAQKAAIYNKTFFGGIANDVQIAPGFKNVTGISGILTDYQNPFITNFEVRDENNVALRSFFELKSIHNHAVNLQAYLGYELQHNKADIVNYTNNLGNRGTVMAADRLKGTQQFVFSRLSLQAGAHFKAEAALSLNFFDYKFESLPQSTSFVTGSKTFDKQFMPRVAMSYLVNENFAFRGTVSRGYSPPTNAEVRASDAKINPTLEAENGWNYELGMRFKDRSERLYADISAFYYRLNNAIVRRVNALDQDYYTNAGGTKQKGLEFQVGYQVVRSAGGFVRDLTLNNATTLNDFTFRNYVVATTDLSGKQLTGVPDATIINTLSMSFPKQFSIYVQDQYTSKIPLTDANSAFAASYHLLGIKAGWSVRMKKQSTLGFNAGVDNLLNKQYSLGNDLNAFGNRFYNAAPLRNYFFGLKLKI